MRNLEEFGVQELNSHEINETEGGLILMILPYIYWALS